MMLLPDNVFAAFRDEFEKVASMERVRAARAGMDAAASRFSDVASSLGLRQFVPFTKSRAARKQALASLRTAKREGKRELGDIENEALRRATSLGPSASEDAAVVRASRLARRGWLGAAPLSPAEKARAASTESLNKFKSRALIGAGAVGAGGLYLATRPREPDYTGE